LSRGSVSLCRFLLASQIILVDDQFTYINKPLSVSPSVNISPKPERDPSRFFATAEDPSTEPFSASKKTPSYASTLPAIIGGPS
jgi:hypothetical protein